MATKVTPLELAKKYLVKIGINPFAVERALVPSLFNSSILCKKLSKSDIIPHNKKGGSSSETHIYINRPFVHELFSAAQINQYLSNPIINNNQLSDQKVLFFEANIAENLIRRTQKQAASTYLANQTPIKVYNRNVTTLINSSCAKWINMHNDRYQVHISRVDQDGDEFSDFRLGILVNDYLIALKYANQDCLLLISVPSEFVAKYTLIHPAKINRSLTAKDQKIEKDYALDDSEYSSDSNSGSVTIETTPLAPLPAPKKSGSKSSSKGRYSGKPSIGKGAISNANYLCECDKSHVSFTSRITKKNYMEPHHLIPISKQNLYEFSIDITSNIICLCPTCHKKIHYGTMADQRALLEYFYKLRSTDLKKCGIDIDIITLLAYYDIK